MKINQDENENAKVQESLPNWIMGCEGKLYMYAQAWVLDAAERLASHSEPFILQELPVILGYENLSGLGGEEKNPCPWQELNSHCSAIPAD